MSQMPPPTERRRVRVTGTVQGVGFRPFVFRQAVALGLAGFVLNDSAGVLIEVEGDRAKVAELCRLLEEAPPPLARVTSVEMGHRPRARGVRGLPHRRERRRSCAERGGQRRQRHLRRLPGRGGRPRGPPSRLPVHQLHELRAALHHRALCPLRPPRHDHGRLQDVRPVPGRVRRPGGQALPRPAERLSRLRPADRLLRPDGRASGASTARRSRPRSRRFAPARSSP